MNSFFSEELVNFDTSLWSMNLIGKYPEPLKSYSETGGHMFATIWHRIPEKNSFHMKYVCIKCKYEMQDLVIGRRNIRTPSSAPLETCDEVKTRCVIEG
jgi:hypothetical protein